MLSFVSVVCVSTLLQIALCQNFEFYNYVSSGPYHFGIRIDNLNTTCDNVKKDNSGMQIRSNGKNWLSGAYEGGECSASFGHDHCWRFSPYQGAQFDTPIDVRLFTNDHPSGSPQLEFQDIITTTNVDGPFYTNMSLCSVTSTTASPITSQPSTPQPPTKYPTKYPTISPTKVLMDYDLEDDDNIVINDTKGILIGVSISTTLFISGCFIWGICVLCKKKRRSIRKRKKLRSDTNSLKISMDSTQVIMDGIYGHRMTADFDVTNINIANSHNAQFSPEEVERYLSDAQKEQLYKAAGGSSNCNSNVELQGDDSRTDASLSDAQKEEMRENEGIIPHSEGGPLPRREPNLRREPTTADVDHLMMKDESDNDVVQHVDTPFGPRLSPIVLGNTHVGDTDDGPEDGEFFEIVYDEGEYIE